MKKIPKPARVCRRAQLTQATQNEMPDDRLVPAATSRDKKIFSTLVSLINSALAAMQNTIQ